MNQICVFDFDGVIANSIHDSFMTAINSYIRLKQNHGLPLKAPIDSPVSIFQFEKNHPHLFKNFSQFMPLASRAEDYYVTLQILEKNQQMKIRSQEDFNIYKETIGSAILDQYHHLFYEVRHNMQKNNPESWSELLPPFPGVVKAIKVLYQRMILAIATSKDRISIDLQLNHYRLTDYFYPDHILDKDFAKSKDAHLAKLQRISGIPFQNIYFIDDKVSHLIATKPLGVRNFLAEWGFNSEREHELAIEEGFTILRLNELKNVGLNNS